MLFGLVSQVLTIAIQDAVDRRDLGIATASANLFRSLGGAVGVAAFGAVYTGASVFHTFANHGDVPARYLLVITPPASSATSRA